MNEKYQTVEEYVPFSQHETNQDLSSIFKNLVSFKIFMDKSGVLKNVLNQFSKEKG